MVVVGGGGGCTYDYSVSLSPNLWIMTFNLVLDLGLTINSYQQESLAVIQHLSSFLHYGSLIGFVELGMVLRCTTIHQCKYWVTIIRTLMNMKGSPTHANMRSP